MKRHAVKKKDKGANDQAMFDREVRPTFGDRDPDKILKREIIELLDRKFDQGFGCATNRLQSLIHSVFAFGVADSLITSNPADKIRPRFEEKARDRKLETNEIATFLNALDNAKMTDGTRDILRLCLLTGQRVNEITRAEIGEFNFDKKLWRIPSQISKNGLEHHVPLAPWACDLFEKAFQRSGCKYAFRGNGKARIKPLGRSAAWKAWDGNRDKLGSLADVVVHDMRHTFSTGCGDLGFDPWIIDACTNHISGRSKDSRDYNTSKYVNKKREVFERWEAEVSRILDPESNVITLRA
jgi:integrase